MLKIGITGGIGSGKTTVTRIFSTLKIPVYDADSRAKWLMVNDAELKEKIIGEFGPDAYFSNGSINRPYLASQFSNPEKTGKLNSLVHPRVGKDFMEWSAGNFNAPYILKEAALMYESGSYKLLDKVIVIYSPEELRIQRILKRDPHRSRQQIHDIIQRQMSEQQKLKMADFVVYNDEKHLLVPQVIAIHQEIISLNI